MKSAVFVLLETTKWDALNEDQYQAILDGLAVWPFDPNEAVQGRGLMAALLQNWRFFENPVLSAMVRILLDRGVPTAGVAEALDDQVRRRFPTVLQVLTQPSADTPEGRAHRAGLECLDLMKSHGNGNDLVEAFRHRWAQETDEPWWITRVDGVNTLLWIALKSVDPAWMQASNLNADRHVAHMRQLRHLAAVATAHDALTDGESWLMDLIITRTNRGPYNSATQAENKQSTKTEEAASLRVKGLAEVGSKQATGQAAAELGEAVAALPPPLRGLALAAASGALVHRWSRSRYAREASTAAALLRPLIRQAMQDGMPEPVIQALASTFHQVSVPSSTSILRSWLKTPTGFDDAALLWASSWLAAGLPSSFAPSAFAGTTRADWVKALMDQAVAGTAAPTLSADAQPFVLRALEDPAASREWRPLKAWLEQNRLGAVWDEPAATTPRRPRM